MYLLVWIVWNDVRILTFERWIVEIEMCRLLPSCCWRRRRISLVWTLLWRKKGVEEGVHRPVEEPAVPPTTTVTRLILRHCQCDERMFPGEASILPWVFPC
jgi:hypothetical protein